jgi:hypothetical protein
MTETLFLTDATHYRQADLNHIVAQQLAQPYPASDNLRTATMYSPKTMRPSVWVKACQVNGIRENTARNRLSEVRRWQKSSVKLHSDTKACGLTRTANRLAGCHPWEYKYGDFFHLIRGNTGSASNASTSWESFAISIASWIIDPVISRPSTVSGDVST